MYDDDFMGWQLDDVLEGFDITPDGIAIDSCGEPRDPLMDGDVRDRLDGNDGRSVIRTASALSIAKGFAARDKRIYFDREEDM